jgi:hypothetical protein
MDFLFHVPFFCTAAAGAVAELQTVCFVNIEFRKRKKLILNQVKRASHFVKIIVACPHRLPKLPESTQHKQAIPKKGSLFYSHCAQCIFWPIFVLFRIKKSSYLKNRLIFLIMKLMGSQKYFFKIILKNKYFLKNVAKVEANF